MTSAMPSLDQVSTSIDPLRTGLNADGYDLRVRSIDDKVRIEVVALDDACEDCLVPKEVMSRILVSRLQEKASAITEDDIDITYPVDR